MGFGTIEQVSEKLESSKIEKENLMKEAFILSEEVFREEDLGKQIEK